MGAMSRVKVKLPGGSGAGESGPASELESGAGEGGCGASDGAHPIQVEPNNAPTKTGKETAALSLLQRGRFDVFRFTVLPQASHKYFWERSLPPFGRRLLPLNSSCGLTVKPVKSGRGHRGSRKMGQVLDPRR